MFLTGLHASKILQIFPYVALKAKLHALMLKQP